MHIRCCVLVVRDALIRQERKILRLEPMLISQPELMDAVRDKFAHVDSCPFQGPRPILDLCSIYRDLQQERLSRVTWIRIEKLHHKYLRKQQSIYA